jgi:hypothetical protein
MSTPHRCGKAVNLTLDLDVIDVLPSMAPGRKAVGRFLSELVRAEIVRRETRQEERERIARELLTGQTTLLA